MDSIDLDRLEQRMRWTYESARVRRALIGFAPALLVVLGAICLGRHPEKTMLCGVGLYVLGVATLWYGRDARRAVLPGLAAGLVPLALAISANRVGHVCLGGQCTGLCLPACMAGGLVAGIVVGGWGRRRGRGFGFWVVSSGVALLTGSMGCMCIGSAGLVGLGVGYLVGFFPIFLVRLKHPAVD